MKIFSGTGSVVLTEKICEILSTTRGKLKVDKFSDGEILPLYEE